MKDMEPLLREETETIAETLADMASVLTEAAKRLEDNPRTAILDAVFQDKVTDLGILGICLTGSVARAELLVLMMEKDEDD